MGRTSPNCIPRMKWKIKRARPSFEKSSTSSRLGSGVPEEIVTTMPPKMGPVNSHTKNLASILYDKSCNNLPNGVAQNLGLRLLGCFLTHNMTATSQGLETVMETQVEGIVELQEDLNKVRYHGNFH